MKRIQVQLTEAQERAVRRRASNAGHSVARVIREAVERYVADDERESRIQRAVAVMARFKPADGATDVSAEHDRYLAGIYAAKKSRE
jgi:predicted DNA-binding protein